MEGHGAIWKWKRQWDNSQKIGPRCWAGLSTFQGHYPNWGPSRGVAELWGKLHFLLLKVRVRNGTRDHPSDLDWFPGLPGRRCPWGPGLAEGRHFALENEAYSQALQLSRVMCRAPGKMDSTGYLHRAAGQRWSQNCCWQGSRLYRYKSALGC